MPNLTLPLPWLLMGGFFRVGFFLTPLWRGNGGSLKSERKRTNRGRGGVKSIFKLTLWKNCLIFQAAKLLSCLAVAKSFIKKNVDIFLNFLLWTCIIVVIVYIYICVKNIVIFYVEFTKNNSFLSFHSPIFIQKFISILLLKW